MPIFFYVMLYLRKKKKTKGKDQQIFFQLLCTRGSADGNRRKKQKTV